MLMLVVAFLILYAISVLRAAAQLSAARLCKLPVERFSIGVGPAIWKRISRVTGTTFQVTRLPFGAFVHIRDDGQAAWRRLATVSAAVAGTYLALGLMALVFFASHGVDDGRRWIGVNEVLAAAAGKLEPGDRILAVDGEPLYVETGLSLSERVNARDGAPITLTILRDSAVRDVSISPRRDDRGAWRLGIRLASQSDRIHDVGAVVATAIRYPVAQVTMFVRGLHQVMLAPEQTDVGGPVRLVHELDRALESSWAIAFQLVMSLIVYLAAFVIGFDLIRLALAAVALVRRQPSERTPAP